jgi:hypothetical protein
MMAQQYQVPTGYGQPAYGQPPQHQLTQPRQQYQQQPQQYAARGDRLPPMPGMLQRPAQTEQPPRQATEQPPRQAIVRGAAPELTQDSARVAQDQSRAQDFSQRNQPSSPGWKPIHIPAPTDLGIGTNDSIPVLAQNITPPANYDLGSVMSWLDMQGVRNCQRTRLAEGYEFTCQLEGISAPISVRAIQEAEALKQLVQQVTLQKQGQRLAQR